MRLTLRTLLAYLDDVLEPGNARELGEKIEESEFASGLVHRIRGSMGRLRLTSPKVLGKGLGADPNTVAEYLDNELPIERVPEFEKVCLESDVHLAEVASCHQILTLVLVETAEVDDGLRQRIYSAADKSLSGTDAGRRSGSVSAPPSGAPTLEQAGLDGEQRRVDLAVSPPESQMPGDMAPADFVPSVADRSPISRLWPLAATLLLAFVVTVSILLATGWLGDGQIAQAPEDDNATGAGPPAGPTTPWPSPEGRESVSGSVVPGTPLESAPDKPPVRMPSSTAAGSVAPHEASTGSPSVPDVTSEGGESPDSMRSSPFRPDATTELRAQDRLAGDVTRELPAFGSDTPADSRTSGMAEEPADVLSTEMSPPPPQLPRDVGRNIVPGQVLAVWDAGRGVWLRLPVRATLEVGQRFLGLPTFRPQLLLTNGLQITLDHTAAFEVLEPLREDVPALAWNRGRAVFVGVGQTPAQVAMDFGRRQVLIQQGDPQSEFAVETRLTRTPGSDPATAPRHIVSSIWPLSGRIGIDDGNRPTQAIQGGEVWMAIDDRPGRLMAVDESRNWTTVESLRDIDRSALMELEPSLSLDRSLTLSLMEANQHRRTDVKSLSARCLAVFERFEPVIEAIGDRRQHAHWTAHFRQLQDAVDRDAASSQLVWDALRRTQGPEAEKLYRLLWGYSPSQLTGQAAADLVADLEDESLEVRVLAFENLKQITGMHLYYRPEQPPTQRQSAIKNWQRRLESREIVYRQPPLMFPGDEQ